MSHLQDDVGPGQTATPAEADLYVVEPTVALGDVPDLHVAPTLGLRLAWCRWRKTRDKNSKKL